jgi:hypothetical protein
MNKGKEPWLQQITALTSLSTLGGRTTKGLGLPRTMPSVLGEGDYQKNYDGR